MSSAEQVVVSLTPQKVSLSERLNVQAFISNEETSQSLANVFDLLENTELDLNVTSANPKPSLSMDELPNVIIVELSDDPYANEEQVNHFIGKLKNTETGLVAVARNLSQSETLKYLRMGIDDFLSYPFDQNETAQVLSRFADRSGKLNIVGDNTKVITFFHASGGIGASTIAVNTAISLYREVKEAKKRVCLLDFDVQFGSVALQLDLEKTSPLLDLIEEPERLDHDLLEAMMVKMSDGLHVLTTPSMPIPHTALDKELIAEIIKLARQAYDYVIIDMPQCLTTWTDNIIQQSTDIYVVTKLEVPAIRQTSRLLETFESEGVSTQKFQIIVNEFSGSPFLKTSEDVGIRQAEKSLKRKIQFSFPSAPALMKEAMNLGKPPVLVKPKGPFAKSVSKLVRSFLPEDAVHEAKTARS